MKQTKHQIIDKGLFLYGGLITITLVFNAISNLNNQSSIISLILFLPILVYFLIQLSSTFENLSTKALNHNRTNHPYFGPFSLKTFLRQNEATFLANLFLLSLAISLILFRISLNILR